MNPMDLFTLVIVLVVVGVLLWAANSFIPMEASIKRLLNVVVIIGAVLFVAYWLLTLTSLL